MSFLSNIFGPRKNEIWKQVSDEIGGEYYPDGFFKRGRLAVSHGEWVITFDTYTEDVNNIVQTYTRIRAPYNNKDGFRFNIYSKNIFSRIGVILGMQNIETGDAQFDEKFIIKGQPEDKTVKLFTNNKIKQILERQKAIRFMVKHGEGLFGTKFPEGVDELYFAADGLIRDKERLKELFELFSAVLAELYKMGSAYKTAANIKLRG